MQAHIKCITVIHLITPSGSTTRSGQPPQNVPQGHRKLAYVLTAPATSAFCILPSLPAEGSAQAGALPPSPLPTETPATEATFTGPNRENREAASRLRPVNLLHSAFFLLPFRNLPPPGTAATGAISGDWRRLAVNRLTPPPNLQTAIGRFCLLHFPTHAPVIFVATALTGHDRTGGERCAHCGRLQQAMR